MSTIAQQPAVTSVSDSDLVPLFTAGSQTTRRATVAQLRTQLLAGLVVPGGVLASSSIYKMQGANSTVVIPSATIVTLGATQFSQPSFSVPASQTSLQPDPVNGRFIATRDIALFRFDLCIFGTWSLGTAISLTLGIGDPANLYVSTYRACCVGAGNGAGMFVSLYAAGVDSNQNDTLATLRAGQVIQPRLAASASDTLNITRIAFSIQPLDGK